MRKRRVFVLVEVRAPKKLSDVQVADLIDQLLNVGYADAAESVEMEDHLPAATDIMTLDIIVPTALKEDPRCHVPVRSNSKNKRRASSK